MTDMNHEAGMPDDRISVIAKAVRDAYGDDAVIVAQRQVEMAEEASRADWIAVLDRLRHR